MAKVYVSSTIVDLKRERRAVMDWLVTAGHQPVHSVRPDGATVQASSLGDVATCDLYVLIVGHRYGFQRSEDNLEGLSITHLEYQRAGQAGIPRIALLRTSIPDTSLSDLAEPQKLARVLAFRDEVTRDARAVEFSDDVGLIQGLSTGVQSELAKQSAAAAGAVWASRLALPPALLAGRKDLLAQLDDHLAGGEGSGPRMVALHGLGGAGKSSVALAYAHRHLAVTGIAWQLAAEDTTVLAAGFAELAAQLGAGEAAGDPVASVHAILAAYPAGWLLVFDNAPDRASVDRFLPPAGDGRVLITSRNALWPPGQAVEVPVLDSEVAAGFLAARTGDADHQAAVGLAEELGGLPLALELAAAYTQATGTTLAGYLSLFRDRRADLLARGEAAGHPADVAATLGLALSRLEEEAPAAAGLLRLLSCLAPEPVPLTLLLADGEIADDLSPDAAATVGLLLGDSVAAGDAVAALRRYSLVTPAGAGVVLVHRLVQATTLAQMPGDVAAEWKQAAAALVQAAIPADTRLPAAWPVHAVLLPHARAVLDMSVGGMWQIAQSLGHSGSYLAARDLFQLIADAHMKDDGSGPEHPDTLTARHSLARWTGEAGDAAGARDQFAALLPIQERVLGPEHPDTLTARHSLARWTGEAGDAAGARDQLAALLPIQERLLDAEHREILATRQNLAFWTGVAGDAAGARDRYAALVPLDERVLGPEHPDTLTARANLAIYAGKAGDAAGARDQLATLLPIRERVLGPEHPENLITRSYLAGFTGHAGDAAGARDQLAALLPIEERVLGAEHPATLTDRHGLAHWTGDAGDAARARDRYAALVPIRERVSGPEHPATLAARDSLARFTGEAGDAAGARDQFAALLPIFERVSGPEHPDTLHARSSLARWTGNTGDAAGARDQSAALLSIYERVSGPEHPDTLAARSNLASYTGRAGDPAGARDQSAALLPIYERVLGPEHPDSLLVRHGVAVWTGQAGDPAGARDQYAALLPVREQVSGPEHPDTLAARSNLAYWTGEAGDPAGAWDQYAALLPIYERVLGPEHPDTLRVRDNFAYWARAAEDGPASWVVD